MEMFEEAVLRHLTCQEGFFVTQMEVPWDELNKVGGSAPDLIAIHPEKPGRIYLVEVSARENLKNLSEKISNRSKHWYEWFNFNFEFWGRRAPFEFKSIAFIRRDARNFSVGGDDIVVRYLEDIVFHWRPELQTPSLP
ncbi:MAG TPA: hypothetical protein VE993_07730 [Stellaceae bacterium]|nr:hypothetical protein [Stellaceae bacterium]